MNFATKTCKLASILAVPAWLRALLQQRVAAGVEHAGVLRNLGSVRTVVDVGANRGQFALAARHCFPAAQIISFEPLAGPAAIYRSVFVKDKRTKLIEAALGPETGEAIIHVSERDDSSSLLPITPRQNELFPGTAEAGEKKIRVTRLSEHLPDKAIQAPALLKLDVQGFELQALAGCEDRLSRFAWVYAELSFMELYSGQALADDVIAWLRERGFTLRGVYHMVYDREGRAVQADFLFGKKVG